MLQPGAESATPTAGVGGGAGAVIGAHRDGEGGGVSSDVAAIREEESRGGGEELGGGGNRWPRQETLALLQIRSDMDAVFRDSSHKGQLWEDVSRKMAEMGYRRSAKKCREKFENVYKYHKRTKDGRTGKADGKTYRFFEQLEALEANQPSSSSLLPPVEAAVPISMAMPPPRPPITTYNAAATQPQVTVPSTFVMPGIHHLLPPVQPPPMQNANAVIFSSSPSGTPSSSSSTSSDEEITGMRSKRKRKWRYFFEKLTKDVMEKQEDLQRKFLEAIEKRENDRRVREEAWKAQEIARLKREHDILAQERSMDAAKDAALISFLQKLSHHQQIALPPAIIQSQISQPQPPPRPPTTPTILASIPVPVSIPISQTMDQTNTNPIAVPATTQAQHNVEPMRPNNGDPSGCYSTPASSSRWPKAEIDALINLRTSLEHKYQESGPKGPLWEEISAEMRKLGYNRSSKRCKEKWENINKYFKKVKESNKKRREDSKTCPYYHHLEALYREKSKTTSSHQPRAGDAALIMAKPEQQWPLAPATQQDPGSDNVDHDYDDEDDGNDEDDEDQAGGFETVANSSSTASVGGATAAAKNS